MKNALFTDFYELTMAQGYWKLGKNHQVVFDMFFRKHPFNGGFSIFAGIETLLELLKDFSFSSEDINYLSELGMFDSDFLDYLSKWRFTGSVYSMDEGSFVFPQEPLVRIHGNLIECQIIEGLVLNICNFQSLIATKTARIYLSSGKGNINEFGLRRAQGIDGAISATRASFIGGATSTSNTLSGKLFGVPVSGTMAHSWVMSFDSELEAFEEYARLYPDNCVLLIDTYDSLNSGIENAIIVGKKLKEKGCNFGVRLDSGDISYLSRKVREKLDEAGLNEAFICVSNDLTEEIIESLVLQNVPVDMWGVGTNLVTGGSESSFTGVYKLCARADNDCVLKNDFVPVMKLSDNPVKNTNPGIKNVWRLYDEKGFAMADIISMDDEIIEADKEYVFYHTMMDYRQFKCRAFSCKPLLKLRFKNGKPVEESLSPPVLIQRSRNKMEAELKTFDPSYLRNLNPHVYKVSVTEQLKNLKMKLIDLYQC